MLTYMYVNGDERWLPYRISKQMFKLQISLNDADIKEIVFN